MLKGHVCIDLHNHRSGFTEKIEGDNDVTDALVNELNHYLYYSNNIPNYYAPLATTILGGIFLLDKELSGSDIFIPGDANIIGSGFQGFDSTSDIIGAYNSVESGIDDTQRIYTHVWDFATSQANGTIRSLGLTATKGGQYPNTLTRNVGISDNSKQIIYVDTDNNDVYYTTTAASNATIFKSHCNTINPMMHTAGNIPTGVSTGKTINTSNQKWMYGYDGYIYKPSVSGSNLVLSKVKVSDLSFEDAGTLTLSFSGYSISSLYAFAINMDVGYVYLLANDRQMVLRYDTNSNFITVFDTLPIYSSGGDRYMIIMPEGDLYILNYYNKKVLRINTEGVISHETTLTNTNDYAGNYPRGYALDTGLIVSGSSSGSATVYSPSTLKTNFNLQSAVEKTTSTSMKVTYTLTQS